MINREANENNLPFITIISLIVAIVSILVSGFISLSVFGFDSRFQALENSIDSFRIGLTDQINAIKYDLETIEKISSILEQRMDITTSESAIINQLIQDVNNRLTAIEQALNQSLPSSPPSILPVRLSISHPKSGDEVNWITSVTGNSTGIVIKQTLKIYLLVYPVECEGPWFIQNRPTINPDGSWSGLVYFGRDPDISSEDVGDQFLLLAIVTTSDLRPGETLTESEIPESAYQSLISGLVRK